MVKKDKLLTKLILIAAEAGVKDAVDAAIMAGASVNSVDRFGATALHEAAANGHLEIVKYLLEKGADKTRETLRGNLAIDLAKRNHFNEICTLLTQ